MMVGALYAADAPPGGALLDLVRDFTPRFEIHEPTRDVVLDLSGLTRLFGHPRAIGDELRRSAAARGLHLRVAIAGTCTTARLLACRGGQDIIIVEPGTEAAAVAPLPIALLAHVANEHGPNDLHDVLTTFRRWGLRTLGHLAALPADAVAARLGADGVRWQRLARGDDLRPLRPAAPEERFEQALDLEWPIEGLEPLSFVLGRLLDPLTAHLERRGRGAAVLRLRLSLVTRAVHERSLELPAPMRDPRALRTLLLLDLESHPPPAAIDRVVVAVDPTPARVLQYSLLTRPLPSPDQVSTLTARLAALLGEGRCGSPALVDSWQPGACAMTPFAPRESIPDRPRRHGDTETHPSGLHDLRASVPPWLVAASGAADQPVVALRRFRVPVPVRVRVDQERPVRVIVDRVSVAGGGVTQCAGPWRTSGAWWAEGAWDRDEWDVTLSHGATCRIFRDRATGAWFLEGIVD